MLTVTEYPYGPAGMLLLVCCVVTAAFALAALLMLPLGWMCAVGRLTSFKAVCCIFLMNAFLGLLAAYTSERKV